MTATAWFAIGFVIGIATAFVLLKIIDSDDRERRGR